MGGCIAGAPEEASARDKELLILWQVRRLHRNDFEGSAGSCGQDPWHEKAKKVEQKWVNMSKEALVEEFRAFDARKGAQPLAGPKWEELSFKTLRMLADKTPGMIKQKKIGTKWVDMNKEELVEEFKASEAKSGAQPLPGPKTDLEKRHAKRVRQTSEEYKRQRLAKLWGGAQRTAKRTAQRTELYKEKKRARENTPEAKVRRTAMRAAQRTEPRKEKKRAAQRTVLYKDKKRARESRPEAKVLRKAKRAAQRAAQWTEPHK